MSPRCRAYQACEKNDAADIVINEAEYRWEDYDGCDAKDVAYRESGVLFQRELLQYNGMVLHSSAVEYEGRAYLFSGPSGMGKSTHTRLWQQVFGPAARIFNDDKPTLRLIDGTWYAYGTPWCGKDHVNINMKAPLVGICFLKQATENKIRRLSPAEAGVYLIWQTVRFAKVERADSKLLLMDKLLEKIPVYELENNAAPECARLSYETMRKGAEEAGL